MLISFFFLWLSSRSYVNYFNSKYQYIFIPNSLLRSTTCNYLYEYLLIRASLEQNISLWLILVVINKDVTYIILYYISLVCYFICVFVCVCLYHLFFKFRSQYILRFNYIYFFNLLTINQKNKIYLEEYQIMRGSWSLRLICRSWTPLISML